MRRLLSVKCKNQYFSVLARQHDDPVRTIPAGVQGDLFQSKLRMGNLLTGVFVAIAILIDHGG